MNEKNSRRYHEFATPKSPKDACDALDKFAAGVKALRNELGIPDVVVIASTVEAGDEDDERRMSLCVHGSQEIGLGLVAQTLGTLQERQTQALAATVQSGRRSARDRE